MLGPELISRSISRALARGKEGELWQYHSRSDHHSKVACWTVLVDLLTTSALMRNHATARKLVFGVNHELSDFSTGRKKILDLVVARPGDGSKVKARALLDLAQSYHIDLFDTERSMVANLPEIVEGPVGAVLVALEAKAAMTEHSKARPRLYDELTSSHSTVHGASSNALAIGLVMVNAATTFLSPGLNKVGRARTHFSKHRQPDAAESVIEKLRELPRRTSDQQSGFDGLAAIVVDCVNDGSPVQIVSKSPAPPPGDVLNYVNMISRVANEYDTRFRNI